MKPGDTPSIERREVDAAAFKALRTAGVPPLLARLYAARGVEAADEIAVQLASLPRPEQLPGLAEAVDRLLAARAGGERICIVGDYDADGATGTALAVRGLRALGYADVDYRVPDRIVHGYGLTPAIVDVACADEAPTLLITVDNGIASVDGVRHATERGVDVIVTDHHLPGATLPAAVALVNPRLDPGSSLLELAGVGVMFFLLIALRAALREAGERHDVPLASWLDIVALGTVADVVPLGSANRILVEQGLRRLRAGQGCVGIRALIEVSGRDAAHLRAADFAFALGPRLNAAGRLEDMTLGVELLLTDDPGRARALAARLDDINRARREIEADMSAEAHVLAGEVPDAWGLCLYDARWHPGVVGIVAGRVRERWHRPVIAFAESAPGTLRGSARSIPGCHIRDAIEAVATAFPGLVPAFGGHAMAAGLTLLARDFDRFALAFDNVIRGVLTPADLAEVRFSDGPLAPADFDLATAMSLERAGPWGAAFPEPIFEGAFDVQDVRIVGGDHVRLRLAPSPGLLLDAIAFGGVQRGWHQPASRVQVLYRLEVNRWRGRETVQLGVEWLQAA